ncbi:MAG: carboxypeptidase regulatory-like domain-containing protein, partial [Terracidiphilus sp.]
MKHWTEQLKRLAAPQWLALALLVLFAPSILAQETTAGLQGTVKDSSGAVVSAAQVVVTGTNLVGSKEVVTDASGYYRFSNLPPGAYVITVKAAGFDTLKREGLVLEVGHLPTVDLELKVGEVKTVVEVDTEGPMIDTTTTTTLTNIPEAVLQDVPHGTSFQSVIEFAPAARNEPLMGGVGVGGNGSGSTSPGNGGNGGSVGYSIGGGADSENSYLVEGQETANIIGGYSHTNVPMDFIQEVQMKTSGVEAEYGGALGGVVNVIMQKGTKAWHGSAYAQLQDGAMNGSLNASSRYDPSSSGTAQSWGLQDPTYQNYQYIRPHTSDFFPGFTLGGPLFGIIPGHGSQALRDRIFLFLGFNPEFNAFEEKVNYGPTNGGVLPFSQNTQTYYSNARIDAEVSQKIRVFGSWLYQLQHQDGEALPFGDSVQGYFNTSTGCFASATSSSNPCLTTGVPQVG